MKAWTIIIWINRHAAIHVCMAALFALCLLMHYLALTRMEACNRAFLVMNDETERSMALVDLVAANAWLAIACAFLIVGAVLFLQIRGRVRWFYRLIAVGFCLVCLAYCYVCAHLAIKF